MAEHLILHDGCVVPNVDGFESHSRHLQGQFSAARRTCWANLRDIPRQSRFVEERLQWMSPRQPGQTLLLMGSCAAGPRSGPILSVSAHTLAKNDNWRSDTHVLKFLQVPRVILSRVMTGELAAANLGSSAHGLEVTAIAADSFAVVIIARPTHSTHPLGMHLDMPPGIIIGGGVRKSRHFCLCFPLRMATNPETLR